MLISSSFAVVASRIRGRNVGAVVSESGGRAHRLGVRPGEDDYWNDYGGGAGGQAAPLGFSSTLFQSAPGRATLGGSRFFACWSRC